MLWPPGPNPPLSLSNCPSGLACGYLMPVLPTPEPTLTPPFRVLHSLQMGSAGAPLCAESILCLLPHKQAAPTSRALEPSADLPSLQRVNLLSAQTCFFASLIQTECLAIQVIIQNNSIQLLGIHHMSGPELSICGISSHAQKKPAGQTVIQQHYMQVRKEVSESWCHNGKWISKD